MKKGIFLDDVRWPHEVTWVNLPKDVEWCVVRSYDAFKEAVIAWYKASEGSLPDIISFDHDLAPDHYIDDGKHKEKTGYDAAKWLVEFCFDNDVTIPNWCVHSLNPVGAQNIDSYMQNAVMHQL